MTSVYQINTQSTSGEARTKWRWFATLGAIFIALGVIAVSNLLLATMVTIYYAGVLIIVAGVVQIIQSFGIKTWDGFFLWLSSGVLYTAAGVMIFMNPLLASVIFTLLLALLTAASGFSRICLGIKARHEDGWQWIIASGSVTTIVGLIFLTGWPVNSLWLLGLVLSIDLIFQGYAMVAFGLQLRKAI